MKIDSRKFKPIIVLIVLVPICIFGAIYFMGREARGLPEGSADVLNWERLNTLDYHSDEIPSTLKDFNHRNIRIPGFIVPLEDSYDSVSEFLLVPDAGSCVHVPPPPPNQMVYVKMKSGQRVELGGFPIWVTGKLRIENVNSPYGLVAYSIEAESTQPFEGWDQFDKQGGK